MPCRDDFWCNECKEQHDYFCPKEEARRKTKSSPPATISLLCEACEILLEEGILDTHASKELQNWFIEHERVEGDRLRYEAARKLTERERRLLGIDLNSLADKVKK